MQRTHMAIGSKQLGDSRGVAEGPAGKHPFAAGTQQTGMHTKLASRMPRRDPIILLNTYKEPTGGQVLAPTLSQPGPPPSWLSKSPNAAA